MMHNQSLLALLCVILLISSCTAVQKSDPDSDVKNFISAFQNSLKTEQDVSKYFEPRLSRETITTVISVLQNRSNEFIQCEASFLSSEITNQADVVSIIVPVTFTSKNIEKEYFEKSSLTLFIKPGAEGYLITKVEGDEFYRAFAKIRNEMEWLVERKLEMEKREPFYAMARALQPNFDSVIWYTEYKDQPFFYVINGTWENYFRNYNRKGKNTGHRMGLVNQDGKIVIPVEYDLVGTPGFDYENIVEVSRSGKVGYYDIAKGKLLIPTEYDLIIPYGKDNITCLVKTDSVYGWFSNKYEYTRGFPSPSLEKWVKEFRFLPAHLQLDAGNQSLCEIPSSDHAGFGIVMPPSYLARTGIFHEIEGGISPTDFPIHGWTDYIETEGTQYTGITEKLFALVTTIKQRYLDGREEFYRHDKVVFVGNEQDTLAVSYLGGAGSLSFRTMGPLLELRHFVEEENYVNEEAFWPDVVPTYSYFLISDNLTMTPQRSDRAFAQTEFVALDSSYFAGNFKHFNVREEGGVQVYGYEPIDFFSTETIRFMRDEILASYGFKFNNEELDGWFYGFRNIPPKSRQEIESMLTETDRHNLVFLETLLREENTDPI